MTGSQQFMYCVLRITYSMVNILAQVYTRKYENKPKRMQNNIKSLGCEEKDIDGSGVETFYPIFHCLYFFERFLCSWFCCHCSFTI